MSQPRGPQTLPARPAGPVPAASVPGGAPPAPTLWLTPAVVLALQASAGNAAVARMLGEPRTARRGGRVVARSPGTPDRRRRGGRWYLTASPTSPTVPRRSTVEFRVENTDDF